MIVNVNKLKEDYKNKPVWWALTRVFGVGVTTAKILCIKVSIRKDLKCFELNKKKAFQLSAIINNNLLVGISLGSFLKKRKDKHYNCNTYKGIRYRSHLPVNGQRTRSNASFGKKFRVLENRKKRNVVKKKRPMFFPKV